MPSLAAMQLRGLYIFILLTGVFASACKTSLPEVELRQDLKFLAIFSSPTLATQEDDKRFSAAFQSKYRTRVVLLRPVAGQAALTQLNSRASLFAVPVSYTHLIDPPREKWHVRSPVPACDPGV